jgi:cobalamin-dependent methionine synthase I
MLDSTQIDVLETGLKLAGGKCIINSVNLEDGEEKLATIAGLLSAVRSRRRRPDHRRRSR